MTVTPDALGMLIALFAFVVTVLGGVGGMLSHLMKRIDARFEHVDARFERVDARFDLVDARFDRIDARLDRMDARFDRMDERFDRMDSRFDRADERVGGGLTSVEHELGEVKIAVARLEGPRRHLQQL